MRRMCIIVIALGLGIAFYCEGYSQAPGVTFQYEYPFKNGVPAKNYRERREKVLATLNNRSLVLSFAADVRNRQNDVDYEYRQNSNFWYLTGMPDPKSALMLIPGGIEVEGRRVREILFVQPRRVEAEVWTGVKMGTAEAAQILGVELALEYGRFEEVLAKALKARDTLWLTGLPTASVTPPLAQKPMFVETELKRKLHETYPDLYIKTTLPVLSALREIKDADEIRLMRKAIDVSIEGHLMAMKAARPGMHEYEIEAEMEYGFKRGGAEDVGYPSIVGTNYNACILHYTTNKKQTQAGDLILADCGAEYQNYTADITRTFPVTGKYTEEQKQIYNVVLEAQDAGIAACRAGNAFREPHKKAAAVIEKRLAELGIIQKPEQVRWYFMHGTSHYLGLDVHDAGTGGALKPGAVITVEPGVYIPAGSPCDKRWWNIGVRIEDDVLITDGDPENLSGALPRTIDDIERLMAKKSAD